MNLQTSSVETATLKIVFLDSKTISSKVDLSILNQFGKTFLFDTTSTDQVDERIKDADIVITNKINISKTNISKARQLKIICIAATGMNNIDLVAAKEAGIRVENVVGYSTESVAQHTFTLALSMLGSTNYYTDYCRSGSWCKSQSFTHQEWSFNELNSKYWGIIGLGSIGQRVARIAEAFGCNIQYYSTSGKNNNPKFKQVDLDTLLQTSDIISIHSPLNEQTQNLLSFEKLSLIQDSAVLVNVGRGGIINEDDLLRVLQVNNFKVALDVIEQEPMLKDSSIYKLKDKKNVLITPHIAWASLESQQRLINCVVANIQDLL